MAGTEAVGATGGATPPGSEAERHRLARLAAWSATVALTLFALQRSLRLPSGFGVEDWLGWSNAESVGTVTVLWCSELASWPAAAAYLIVDQGLFVPLYAALALVLSFRLRRAMAQGQARLGGAVRWLLGPLMVALVGALVVVDTLENLGGALRLGLPGWVFALALLGAAGVGAALRIWLAAGSTGWVPPGSRRLWLFAGLAFTGVALALGLCWLQLASCPLAGELPALPFGWAHEWKQRLVAGVVIAGLAGWAVWWFGGEFDGSGAEAAQQREMRERRAAFRALAAGVVGRSRYVLATLAMLATLTLVLDQCRDVLLALVQVEGARAPELAGRLLVLAAVAVAAAALAHSCWLWSRLVGIVKRRGLDVAAHDQLAVGIFAQAWARALALVPLAIVALLVAMTMGDLVLATRRASDGRAAVWSAVLLVLFALATLGIGSWLVHARRRLHLSQLSDYYNREPDVRGLLWFESKYLARPAESQQQPSQARRLVTFVLGPWLLPVLALVGMAGSRWAAGVAPEAFAAAPLTLLVVLLALTWWLGVLGAVSLWEQRDALPWIVLPVAVAGLLSALNLTDNHALGWPLLATAPLAELREGARLAMWCLVLAGVAAWFAFVLPAHRWPWRNAKSKVVPGATRWAAGLAAVAAAHGGLVWLDGRAGREQPQAEACAARAAGELVPAGACASPAGDSLPAALQKWLERPGPGGGQPLSAGNVYLVAAEGGGIRAAYWTALSLAWMHEHDPEFDRRTVLLSGVSGGSVGHVAYLACLRLLRTQHTPQPRPSAQAIVDCLEARFARLDALTPLLGGLLFEDVFSRVLPLSRGRAGCNQPGCAHVNRAAGFEREWIAAFTEGALAPLAEPLLGAQAGGPLLALNSTWVETGNRTVATNARLGANAWTAAAQLDRCLGHEGVSMIGAAHTSARFPITNPLAGVHAYGPADDTCRSGGHLIDGGYFDNSAVPSLLDVLHALRPLLKDGAAKPVVLLVRNGQAPQGCAAGRETGPDPACLVPAATQRPDPTELDLPGDHRRMTLYADVLGPALALLNVSGIGAHGRAAPAALRAALGEGGKRCAESNVWLIDQVDDGGLVPLGWYLSKAARAALQAQAKQRVPGRCAGG